MATPEKTTRNRARLRLAFYGDLNWFNTLDWLVALSLGALLAVMSLQLGGMRAETQLLGLWMTGFLLLTHALWVFYAQSKKGVQINGWALLPLPFVLYVLLSWWFLSPTPWSARADAIIVVQAFVVFWVVVHSLHNRNQVWLLFLIMGLIGLVSVMAGFQQYFRDTQWTPMIFNPLEMQSFPVGADKEFAGRASGSLGSPDSFAGFLLLAFFPATIFAFSRHLSFVLRVFSGYLAVMFLAGLLLSVNISGFLALIPCLLALPIVLGLGRKGKLLAWGLLLVILVTLASVLSVFSPRISGHWERLIEGGGEPARSQMWTATWEMFADNPVMGAGLGSYPYVFDRYRPEGMNASPGHAYNDYLEILSQLGAIGFLLLFVPVGVLFVKGFISWKRHPYRVDLDEQTKQRRRQKHTPARKLFMGSVILALLAFGIHLLFGFHLHVVALALWAAVFFGLLVKYSDALVLKVPKGVVSRIVYPLVIACLAAGMVAICSRGYVAEMHAAEGSRLSRQFSENIDQYRRDREFNELRLASLQAALVRNPGHVPARMELAQAIADKSFIDPLERLPIGMKAELQARTALELYPHYTRGWIVLGETLLLQERLSEAGEAYRKALELSPNNAIVWYHYAKWLNGQRGRGGDALRAINRSLELNPHSDAAQSLRRKVIIP